MHGWPKSLQAGVLSPCKEISGNLLSYIKQKEARHAGGGGGEVSNTLQIQFAFSP